MVLLRDVYLRPRPNRGAGLVATLVVLLLGVPAAAHAQSASQTSGGAKPEGSTYDKIWAGFTQLYKDDRNPVVQQVLFSGRFHHDFAAIDADQGDLDESN